MNLTDESCMRDENDPMLSIMGESNPYMRIILAMAVCAADDYRRARRILARRPHDFGANVMLASAAGFLEGTVILEYLEEEYA